jgi:hypothetical protein
MRTNFKFKRKPFLHKDQIQEEPSLSFSTKSNRQIAESVLDWHSKNDSELRLQCGELTAQEIRSIRAVLNNIIGYG